MSIRNCRGSKDSDQANLDLKSATGSTRGNVHNRGELKMSRLPLEGIRVTDTTTMWAGSYTTNLLATLGAEVIKVESIQHIDPWRPSTTDMGPREQFWERSPLWNSVNTDKLSVTLDLSQSRGAEIFKQLVKISDIVAENFTPRVMNNFGLDYPVLKEVNPRIIMISLPAYGMTGPWRDYSGYAATIEQMSGVCQLTGYPDGPPESVAWRGFSDPTAGVNGMVAVLFALLFRQMTGRGQYIDLSQVEATTCMIGDVIVDYTMNKRVQLRRGNRHPFMAPHGYYRCRGNNYVGIVVASDKEWKQFCEVLGDPSWSKEVKFADSLSRWHNQDELDKLIEQWTIQHTHYEIMSNLQKVGVRAGAVLNNDEFIKDPHLKERGFLQVVDRSIVGPHPYPIPTASMKFSKSPITIRRPAPLLGEHNDYVLGSLLGMPKEEIQSLADDKIIGTTPLGV